MRQPPPPTLGERISDWMAATPWWAKLLWLWAALTAIGIVVAVVRGSADFVHEEVLAREVSLEEYAEHVCSGNGLVRGATWGEAESHVKETRAEFRSVKPPVELREYHAARIDVFDAVIRFFGRQDPDARAVAIAAMGDDDTMAAYRRARAIEDDLPAWASNELRRAGCS